MIFSSSILILSVLGLSTSSNKAETIQDQLKRIRLIGDDDKRLLAYDTLASSIAEATSVQKSVGTGNWVYETSTDRMTDETTSFVYLKSSKPARNWLDQDMDMYLYILISDSFLTFMVTDLDKSAAFEITMATKASLTFRVDKNPAQNIEFTVKDDVARIFDFYTRPDLTNPKARSLFKQMSEGESLLVRFTGFGGDSQYVTFDIGGFRSALARLESSNFKVDQFLK